MIEHRLIEKMIGIIEKKIPQIRKLKKIEPSFIDSVVDFMQTYTDKIHHGKEEDIYFRVCANKNMNSQESELLSELIEEHELSRKVIDAIVQNKDKNLEDEGVFELIVGKLHSLVKIYRDHIDKEDHLFFPESEKYLSEIEQTKMLEEFLDFDKKVIHEKYRLVVEDLAKQSL